MGRTQPRAPHGAIALIDYRERKGAERGKSYGRQVWETVYVSIGVCLIVVVFGWFGFLN
jgi:hypothetical protein